MIFKSLKSYYVANAIQLFSTSCPHFPSAAYFRWGLQDRTTHHLLVGKVPGSLACGFSIDCLLGDGVGRTWPFQMDWNLSLYHLGGRLCIAGAWTQSQYEQCIGPLRAQCHAACARYQSQSLDPLGAVKKKSRLVIWKTSQQASGLQPWKPNQILGWKNMVHAYAIDSSIQLVFTDPYQGQSVYFNLLAWALLLPMLVCSVVILTQDSTALNVMSNFHSCGHFSTPVTDLSTLRFAFTFIGPTSKPG